MKFTYNPNLGTSYLDQMEEHINMLWVEVEVLKQKVQIKDVIRLLPAGCNCDVTYTGAHARQCPMYGVPYRGEGSS